MANEIRVSAITGLTITVKIYQDADEVGSPIPTTEIGTTGEYLGSMPLIPSGIYRLLAFAGTEKIATSVMNWDGSAEILAGGLNPQQVRDAMTMAPTQAPAPDSVDAKIEGIIPFTQ